MKSLRILAVALFVFLAGAGSVNAQKVGYVNIDGLVGLLPEIAGVQTKLDAYTKDSVGGEYDRLRAEYDRTDSIVKNSKTKSLVDAAQRDRDGIAGVLAQWQQRGQQLIQQKQAELLQPLYKKVMDAVTAVSKEKAYSHVMDPGVFVIAPPGDDLTPAVATKLNVKLPATYKPGINHD